MDDIHNLALLPEQHAINSVAAFSQHFNTDNFDFSALLIALKQTIIESDFMLGQNNAIWMSRYGVDFLATPKLFAVAPLTYICVFLGEIFRKIEVEDIQKNIPPEVLKHALIRLNDFKLH